MSTFLQVVELLLTDPDAKAAYANNPPQFLRGHGLGELDSADVSEAMTHATDALPIGIAAQLDPEAGLESAAGLDLEAQGLSLDREPIELVDDSLVEDTDPFGADVEFDAPEGSAADAADVVDAFDAAEATGTADDLPAEALDLSTDRNDDAEALPEEHELAEEPINSTDELGLTEPLLDELPLEHADGAPDASEADILHTDLQSELTDDLPDDFDLLD